MRPRHSNRGSSPTFEVFTALALVAVLHARSASADVAYLVTLTCGSAPIRQVSLGLVLPSTIDLATVQLGANVLGEADCLDLDPTNCIGATGLSESVDPALSRVVAPNVAGRPNTYYFTLVGTGSGQSLCDNGSAALLKVVAPEDVPNWDRASFTLEGLAAVSAAVPGFPSDAYVAVNGDVLTPDDYAWVVREEYAPVRIVIGPALGDTTGDLWDLVLDSSKEIEELTLGVAVPPETAFGQALVIGCPVNQHPVSVIPCLTNGSLTSNADPIRSWTVGPDASLPRGDVLYFHLVGDHDSSGFDLTLNPLPRRPVRLATIRLDAANGNPPPLVFEGAATLSPSGAAIIESNSLAGGNGALDTNQVALTQSGSFLSDTDGDGLLDTSDTCRFVYDPTNADSGGRPPFQFDPDGIGDACQCGDAQPPGLPGRGIVDASDVPLMLEVLTGLNTDPHAVLRCSVAGEAECNIQDVVVLELATDADHITPPGPGITNLCPGAPVA